MTSHLHRTRQHGLALSALTSFFLIFSPFILQAQSLNGFDLSDLSVPKKYIQSGGPQRDGIPSIDNPRFQEADDYHRLHSTDRVLGVEIDGVAKAYPIKILDKHEIVNDSFNGKPVAVTYCPLCGSGVAFNADVNGRKSFGVSGLLYNSDVLLYDRQTDSLWSQIKGEAIAGPLNGTSLEQIVTSNTTWSTWKANHPDTLVLSTNQGIYPEQLYERESYPGYAESKKVWFPLENKNRKLHPKEVVLGLELNGEYKAYPIRELEAKEESPCIDRVAGQDLFLEIEPGARNAVVRDMEGNVLPSISLYWFAWYAFHPETDIFKAPGKSVTKRRRETKIFHDTKYSYARHRARYGERYGR